MIFTKNLFDAPVLESLLLITFPDDVIDLHSDFNCTSISFEANVIKLTLSDNTNRGIEILMYDYCVVKYNIEFDFNGPIIIDNLYRGRFFVHDNLVDTDNGNRHCFYIHFDENVYLEVLAKDFLINLIK